MKLYLLDAYALIYRAYYALIRSPRINSKGRNTSAIFGFVNTIEEILRKERPDLIAIAFDPAGPTFRHEAYPEYKAQREATPEDIKESVPIIKDLIRAYGIPLLEVAGFEADDVIGTMAHRAAAEGFDVRMITPDKDYAQLVGPHVWMQRPGHGAQPWEVLGVKEVCEKYGFSEPHQMIDYLALMGDASDNIPGCPGVGPKTAATLIQRFGSVENLLAHTDELKGAQRKRVEENAEKIRFSKFLTTIRTDVPLDVQPADLRQGAIDEVRLRQLFEDLEFRTFLQKRFGAPSSSAVPEQLDLFSSPGQADNPPSQSPAAAQSVPAAGTMGDLFADQPATLDSFDAAKVSYTLIEAEADARALCQTLLACERVSIDTETTSLNPLEAELVGLSFARQEGEAWYVAVPAEREAAQRMVEIFRPLYESESIVKIGQNLKYDLNVLTSYGVEFAAPMFDTMLAHYVVQPELRHNLDYLAEIYLNYRKIATEELIGARGKSQQSMRDLPPSDIRDYACEDADMALRLVPKLEAELKERGGERVFREIEMPLMPVLARMERWGVCLDTAALSETERLFSERLQTIEAEIYELAGHPFLISSPRQVGEVLFGELKLSDKARRTKSGQYSTGEEVLQQLRSKHPIVQCILDHRALKKLLNTYVEVLPKLISPRTGHIHTSFNQAVTATGRLSSSNPNLQNIPVRGEDGREIRKAFVPEPGCVFFSADYSQIELRIMANLSKDEHLISAFQQGDDIHAATAARIFGKPLGAVSRDERRKAKTANFGIIYGISAFGLAERMDVPRSEAKALIDSYFQTYPGVRRFIDEAVEQARQRGYIETLFGRRRYLPDINSRNAVVRGYAERNAVNAPIQGTAADIIKIAMIRIDQRLRAEGLHAKMILQVHDELNFSVPQAELEAVRRLVVEEMQNACQLSVPLLADCGEGLNWLEAH
ncbi:MAG: DNA polymerase I [Alloprevotella sp.]|nr:DNA polymerase I [Alloprevotella sp.]